ncbi:MAG: hypothetical protein J0M33_14280 [Anaerolineae bacterium]|nr:hypothetical protein [Anaerolineae bacterium]
MKIQLFTIRNLPLATILLLLIYVLRLPNLTNFPLFIDETVHLYAAEGVLQDSSPLFQVWLGRQFTILWYALFGAPLVAPVFVSRFVTLLVVMMGAAAVLSISRHFGGRLAMILAGFFYALSTYHLFFERLALADNIAGGAILLAAWAALRLQNQVKLSDAVLMGVLLFLAFGAKVSALPYFGIPLAAVVALTSPNRSLMSTMRWLSVGLGVASVTTLAYIMLVRSRGSDVLNNSLSLAISARATADLAVLFSPVRILGNVGITLDAIAPYWGTFGFLLLLGGLIVLVLKRQFYLPLIVLGPLIPMWISVVQETRFLVSAVALLIVAGAVGITQVINWIPSRLHRVAVASVALIAVIPWLGFAEALYINPTQLALPPRDYEQYIRSDASGFNLREAADYITKQGDVVEIIGAMPNCQSLRYMTLHSLPVTCPPISPNPDTGIALLALLGERREPGIYLILERNPYIPQDVPGTLLAEISTPILGRPVLAIYDLAD